MYLFLLRVKRFFGVFLCLLMLGSCGFQPVYNNAAANNAICIESISISGIDDVKLSQVKKLLNDTISYCSDLSINFTNSMLYKIALTCDIEHEPALMQKDTTIERLSTYMACDYSIKTNASDLSQIGQLKDGKIQSVYSYKLDYSHYSNIIAQSGIIDELIQDVLHRLILQVKSIS